MNIPLNACCEIFFFFFFCRLPHSDLYSIKLLFFVIASLLFFCNNSATSWATLKFHLLFHLFMHSHHMVVHQQLKTKTKHVCVWALTMLVVAPPLLPFLFMFVDTKKDACFLKNPESEELNHLRGRGDSIKSLNCFV